MAKVNMTELADEIVKALNDFTDEVQEALEETKKELAKEGVKKIKSASPIKTGKYAKGWSVKKLSRKLVVYNRTRYQLAHLLEHGHAKRGGRGTVAARPHIKKVENELQKKAAAEFEKALNKR